MPNSETGDYEVMYGSEILYVTAVLGSDPLDRYRFKLVYQLENGNKAFIIFITLEIDSGTWFKLAIKL